MHAASTTILGTLKPDGALELDEKPNLPAGRVRITMEPLPESSPTPDPFVARIEAIWAGQRARGHVPRGEDEVEAERQTLRDESEEGLRQCERIHREAEQARRQAGR